MGPEGWTIKKYKLIFKVILEVNNVYSSLIYDIVTAILILSSWSAPLPSPGLILPRVGALVDVVHEPREGPRVERLGHRVSVLPRLAQL